MTPTVSVITCTYNRASLLPRAIESVLAQTLTDFEYLIVDDGSADDTEAVVAAYRDIRIRYIRLPHSNGYLSMVRNSGLQQSRGTFIAFLDSDDTWHPEKLEQQINALKAHPSAGFSFTQAEIKSQGDQKLLTYPHTADTTVSFFSELLEMRHVIYTSTLLLKSQCLEKVVEFDARPSQEREGQKGTHLIYWDYDFLLRLAYHYRAIIIQSPLATIHKHEQNHSRNVHVAQLEVYYLTLDKVYRQGMIDSQTLRRRIQELHYSFGMQLRKARLYPEAARFFVRRIRSEVWHLRSWYRLAGLLPALLHKKRNRDTVL